MPLRWCVKNTEDMVRQKRYTYACRGSIDLCVDSTHFVMRTQLTTGHRRQLNPFFYVVWGIFWSSLCVKVKCTGWAICSLTVCSCILLIVSIKVCWYYEQNTATQCKATYGPPCTVSNKWLRIIISIKITTNVRPILVNKPIYIWAFYANDDYS